MPWLLLLLTAATLLLQTASAAGLQVLQQLLWLAGSPTGKPLPLPAAAAAAAAPAGAGDGTLVDRDMSPASVGGTVDTDAAVLPCAAAAASEY